ncbi:MAG: 5-methylthioadenosine phosphorylase [Moorella sp. (in: firmicutes)]|uniref:S-methyl-5'-thioadenosine phosphorylase n=1 Tax=unclassified Neomoorella TaxID=2676739 RepID=UPI0010FFB783|nr:MULTISPECIES: S-methyl-5'-thioadenosine phosphorylase [unclassified Moorella (in: firmicutes)]MDK2816870.1 5-methylthioadenosine phosphorylase [Moorella sp. (in: firmicutes)]MDK2895020.1 5-methylthioadenosine phosphorylase [Moorella sp. (in: firmicutes)]GEA14869.1 putative 6-oxopurine nucleoside phosphorylase [Moorella sp. E308F]GEA17703.1 putative 6-oxopurine nucleoside phosphorylase [Moorella sp. E306M]
MRIAIIGGSGVYDPGILSNIREERVETPYGTAVLKVGTYQGEEIGFMPRHGEKHTVPPHRVNYRANIWALKMLQVERVLATAAVGSTNPDYRPGDFVIVNDFLDFTKTRTYTFFEGGETGVVHTDFTTPYCPELRRLLVETAAALGIKAHDGGVYACTEGPRFETPAEIRMIRQLGGDLVGMTNVPEVILAHEVGLCYGLIAMVTNMAAGISATPLSHAEVLEIMDQNGKNLRELIMQTIPRIPRERNCRCSLTGGKIEVHD